MNVSRALALLGLAWVGCQTPVLDGLEPASGPPGTIVEVKGSYLEAVAVLWDADTSSEQALKGSIFLSPYFTVPDSASVAQHNVRLDRDGDKSAATQMFSVIEGHERGKPRIDDITVTGFQIRDGVASMNLFVHGANIDVGAKLKILEFGIGASRVTYETVLTQVMRNEAMNAQDPSTLGYAIYHYASVMCQYKGATPGKTLNVIVENVDGRDSKSHNWLVPATMAELDSDGDGLLDSWEVSGYDHDGDETIDVDLPGMGADRFRKDLFIEVDVMKEVPAPHADLFESVRKIFAAAPVLNSDGSTGITVHIDDGTAAGGKGGDEIDYTDTTGYEDSAPFNTTEHPDLSYSNFYAIKEANFDAARLNIFRYCVFVNDNGHKLGSSGQAEDILCNDFFVSLGTWNAFAPRLDIQTGTFLHELGHALGLQHGGDNDSTQKKNYNSVMPYNTGWATNPAGDVTRPSPSQFGGIDVDGDLTNASGVYTYSQGQRAELKENSLVESKGVCDGIGFDWDGDGTIEGVIPEMDLDGTILKSLKDHADWSVISLPFTQVGSKWGGN